MADGEGGRKPSYEEVDRQLTESRIANEVLAGQLFDVSRQNQSYVDAIARILEPPFRLGTVTNKRTGPDGYPVCDVSVDGKTWEVSIAPDLVEGGLGERVERGVSVRINPESYCIVGVRGHDEIGYCLHVEDTLDDGRVAVRRQDHTVVVYSNVKDLKPGELVRVDGSCSLILERIPRERKELFVDEIEPIEWGMIGGLDDTIGKIREELQLAEQCPEELRRMFPNYKTARGMLLYGPPGCGKTMVAKAIAHNMRDGGAANGKPLFMHIKPSDIFDPFVGIQERKASEAFALARKRHRDTGRVVTLFFDEAEALLARKGGPHAYIYDRLISEFGIQIDGLDSLQGVRLILASNYPTAIDDSIVRPGRVDRKFEIKRPGVEGARQILGIYLRGNELDPRSVASLEYDGTVDEFASFAVNMLYDPERYFLEILFRDDDVKRLAYADIMSGAILKDVVDRATRIALIRLSEAGESGRDSVNAIRGLSVGDLQEAVQEGYLENLGLVQMATPDDVQMRLGRRYNREIVEIRPYKPS